MEGYPEDVLRWPEIISSSAKKKIRKYKFKSSSEAIKIVLIGLIQISPQVSAIEY